MVKVIIIVAAVIYFIVGVFITALITVALNTPIPVAALMGMIVGITVIPLSIMAWDRWV